jgi:hypothetical protein
MNWDLEIAFHWPHNRLALGWEFIEANEKEPFTTIRLYLLVVTLTLDIS